MRRLIRYLLSPSDRRALRWTDSYSLHRIVYDLFENVRGNDKQSGSGILFVDKGVKQGMSRVLILSDRDPRTPRRGTLETLLLPESYLSAPAYSFEVVVNPTRRDNRSGRIIPVCGPEAIKDWFCAHGPAWGFSVRRDMLQVAETHVDRFDKKGMTATIARARLTGRLEVTDHGTFVKSVCQGIGRARAFGCGLLQVVPAL